MISKFLDSFFLGAVLYLREDAEVIGRRMNGPFRAR